MQPVKIALIPNLTRSGVLEVTRSVIKFLHNDRAEVLMSAKMQPFFNQSFLHFYSDTEQLIQNCDIIVTIGGDGTIIHIAKPAAHFQKPILGINMGHFGFVAGLEPNEFELLHRLIIGDYTTEKRMMLSVTLKQDDTEKSYYALNDAVISRGTLARLIDIDVSMNNGPICRYHADGLIIATPTGSSAYSLSAGGPVIEPTMSCILMTPICSHALFARPVLFNAKSQIMVTAGCDDSSKPYLTIDGEDTFVLKPSDVITITAAQRMTELIVLKEKTFYKVLNDKFAERGF